jgi:hypothetical protein
VEFKTNDGVKQSLRPKAGAVLFTEFRDCLLNEFGATHVVIQEGKMVGPSHMTITLAPEKKGVGGQGGGKLKMGEKGGKGNGGGTTVATAKATKRDELIESDEHNDSDTNTPIDPHSALAEAHVQGETVRALKLRRSAGDDAVREKDVDHAVAKLLALKNKAQKASTAVGAKNPSLNSAARGAHTAALAFFGTDRPVCVPGAYPPNSRHYSKNVVGEVFVREAKAKAKAARRTASERKRVDVYETTFADGAAVDGVSAGPRPEDLCGAGAGAGASGVNQLGDTEKAPFTETPVNSSSNRPEEMTITWSDPSTFRLGGEAEEHVAYQKEKIRVDALLESRRVERAEVQKRIDAVFDRADNGIGSGNSSKNKNKTAEDRSSGAWAGAAAAATLALAVAATLFATADSQIVDDAYGENRSSSGSTNPARGTSLGSKRTSFTFGNDVGREDGAYGQSVRPNRRVASDSILAYAAGAAVVFSALGWPPPKF